MTRLPICVNIAYMTDYPNRPTLERELAAEVRAEIARSGLKIGEVAEIMSISRQALNEKLKGRTSFRAVELDVLAKRVGLVSNELYRRAEEAALAAQHNTESGVA